MSKPRGTRGGLLGLGSFLIAGTLTLSACSATSESPSEENALTPLSVAVLPIADVVPVYLAHKLGYFEEEGLDVDVKIVSAGAATVAGLASGEYQFAYTAPIPIMQAALRGIETRVIATSGYQTPVGNENAGNARPSQALFVAEDAPIHSIQDLSGKSIAINAIGGMIEILVKNTLEQAGVAPDSVEFVELPLPNMPDAVLRGTVDAAMIAEPFASMGEALGTRMLASPFDDTDHPVLVSLWTTTPQYADENPEIIKAFADAIGRGTAHALENEDLTREVLVDQLGLDPNVANSVVLPGYTDIFFMESVEEQRELAMRYGVLGDEALDLDLAEIYGSLQARG